MFCDLVGSTELSGRHDPEHYGLLVRRYISEVRTTIEDRFGGQVVNVEGDGLLALFGAPHAHGDDAERAIRAALDVVDRVTKLSAETERDLGEALAVRIAVHRGQIYRTPDGDVYGLTTNVAARLQTLAAANEVVVSDEVQRIIGHIFETEAGEPQVVKGVDQPIRAHRIVRERTDLPIAHLPSAPFVDREEEWGRLRAAWQAVRSGAPAEATTLFLRGEAGIGKSYLASRIVSLAREEGAPTVELAGSAIFEASGLHPVRRLIERSTGVTRDTDVVERLQRLRADLAGRGLEPESFVPRLAPILGLEPTAGYVAEPMDARKLNEEILEAAYQYVESLLGEASSILLVEDIQWFDESTRELVARVAVRKPTCLLVITARSDAVPFEGVDIIDLAPFSQPDSAHLVDALCTGTLISAEYRSDVVARSDGIPLYIEQLVANIQQGVPSVPDETNGQSGAVPDLLYDLLAARLDSPSDVIPVATASAVMGRDVDRNLLQTLLNLAPSELDTALDTLCAQGVLERRDREGQFRFHHELLREVAYELEPPSRRRALHGKLADALTSLLASGSVVDWGVVGTHFERAGRASEASEAYEEAAGAARRRGAFREAEGYLGRAIDLLTSSVDHDVDRDVREVKLRLQRGYMAVSEEGLASPAAAADYQRCLELTAADPFGDEMFNTVIVLWTYHLIRGELAQARQISEYTYRTLEKREWYRSFNIAAFGILDCWEGDFHAARGLLDLFRANRVQADEERFLAEWMNPNEPVTVILTCIAVVNFVMGDVASADPEFAAAIQRAEVLPFPQGPYSAAYVLSVDAWMRFERGQLEEAEDRINRMTEIADRHGFDGWKMVAMTQHAVLAAARALHEGIDPRELARHASTLVAMIDLWKRFDTRFFLPYYQMMAGLLYAGAGDKHNAQACYESSLRLAAETGMQFWRAETIRHLAHLELNPEGQEERLREALEIARSQRANLFELRIALDLAELDPSQARAELTEALDRLGRDGAYPEVTRAQSLLAIRE
ncbi:MAG TPA: adenylate/guanylate cyclase domain-containing protein [Acidimicrobiales bacterium]|nr:adenylate/guanylate cyclase domain-containing protein [Acidimicrobiales bacterium]